MRVRTTVAAVGLVAVAVAMTGCNNTGSSSSGSDAKSSSSPSTGGHLDKASLVRALTVGQVKAGSAHVQMAISGASALKASGDVTYHGSSPEMKMTMSMAQLGQKQMKMRYVGGIFYMTIPQIAPAGKFVKFDPHDKNSPVGKAFGGLTQQMDPLSSFRAMKSAVRTVRYVGHGSVSGVPADHYVVTVDSAALLRAEKQKSVPGMPAQLRYDMWFDNKDLLRETDYDVAGVHGHMVFSRWGEPVHVSAPPASQVVDASKLGQTTG